MGNKPKNYDASKSALGYLYQIRYGLLLALEKSDASDQVVSIETLDDVAISDAVNPSGSTAELFQLKHHVSRQGGTSNLSLDIWKSLRIWSDAISAGMIDIEKSHLLLVTTSTSAPGHAISGLRAMLPSKDRKTELVRKTLEEAAKSSQNGTVKDCFKSLRKLPVAKRRKLFSAIVLVDGSPGIMDVRDKIEKNLWAAVEKERLAYFVDQIEGWWFAEVIAQLSNPSCSGISVRVLHARVSALREELRRQNLPDELLHENVPDGELSDTDRRVFVRQLRVIRVGQGRIRKAQENHYRAVTQRSRWIRSNLLDLDEWDRFEIRLIGEWEEFYTEMADGLDDKSSDDDLVTAGDTLFKWANAASATQAGLCIRSEFRSPYLTRGSFHMLSDQRRIGWHRDFKKVCQDEDAA